MSLPPALSHRLLLVAAVALALLAGCDDAKSDDPIDTSGAMDLDDAAADTSTEPGDTATSSDGGDDTVAPDDTTGSDASSDTATDSTSTDTASADTPDTSDADDTVDPMLPPITVYQAADEAEVCNPTPAEDCTPSDMTWVASEYGSTVTRADAPASGVVYRLVALVERLGPSNIDVLVVDETGAPLEGIEVAFWWQDAPDMSRPDEWYPNKVVTPTGADGIAGFALGGGAYLPDCGAGGPHAIWVSEPNGVDMTIPSDLVDKLGMLGGTNHRHLDLVFERVPMGAAPSGNGPRCPLQP